MFGTVVEQLESAIDEVAAFVSSMEAVEVSRSEAPDARVRFERLRERFGAAIGGLATEPSGSARYVSDPGRRATSACGSPL